MISTGFEIGALKHNILEYISKNGDEHYFMYDLYDEVKELKEQIMQLESQVEYI
jgi:flavoprotein